MSTGDDGKKPPRRDPFAPLPLDESLTGKTKGESPTTPARKAATLPPPVTRPPTIPPPLSRPATIPPPIKASSNPETQPERPAVLSSEPSSPTTSADVGPDADREASDATADIPTLDPDPTGDAIEAAAPATDAAAGDAATPDAGATSEPAAAADDPTQDEDFFSFAKKSERAAKRRARKEREREREERDVSDDDDDRPRKGRVGVAVAALALVIGGGIAAAVLLGRVNSGRYAIVCTADRAVVERGRVFPPWGTKPMLGGEWVPLELPPEAPCTPRETENLSEVSAWFGKMLEDRATTLLTAREVSAVDQAEGILKQALLVARSLPTDDERIDARERIERMLGDVAYWRASARLEAASEALVDAAKQFDAAALQKPRYVTDAAAWAAYARKLADELKIGPAGVDATAAFPPAPPDRPTAPLGTELPVEPGGETGGSAEPTPPPPPSPTADTPAPPSGGVLL